MWILGAIDGMLAFTYWGVGLNLTPTHSIASSAAAVCKDGGFNKEGSSLCLQGCKQDQHGCLLQRCLGHEGMVW